MKTINVEQELKFINSEKTNISNKKSLSFELLNITDVLITNYINAKTLRMKRFYKMIYGKTKGFYLEQSEKRNLPLRPRCSQAKRIRRFYTRTKKTNF